MPVPLPVDLVMGALPLGFKGNLQEYANAIADGITATVDATFLTGQVGGNPPTSDIGPWANGGEWWFWDPATGQYQPSDQGTPVGSITIWGGQGAPVNWLLCDGRAVARTVYSRLFQKIGETWGAGDGISTFNLPPGGVFFVNAPGFVAATQVPITPGYQGQGVNARGGGQTITLASSNMPSMQIIQPFILATLAFKTGTGSYSIPNVQGEGASVKDGENRYSVRDANGTAVGGSGIQTPASTMPPFCAANFVIKYQ